MITLYFNLAISRQVFISKTTIRRPSKIIEFRQIQQANYRRLIADVAQKKKNRP